MEMLKWVVTSALISLAIGCVGAPVKMPAGVQGSNYETLGEGEGRATGFMLMDFIPIGQNSRFQRAYDAAVNSQGGDGLVDVQISERWFWGLVGDGFSTTVRGTVIKLK